MLLLSDAQRRGGDSAAAERTWLAAADLLTDLAAGPARIADPILLERAAYLRPANTPWPRPAQQRLCDVSVRQGIIFPVLAPQRAGAADQRHGRGPLVDRHRSLAAGPQRVAGGADRLEAGRIDDQQPAGRRAIADCRNAGPRAIGTIVGRHGHADQPGRTGRSAGRSARDGPLGHAQAAARRRRAGLQSAAQGRRAGLRLGLARADPGRSRLGIGLSDRGRRADRSPLAARGPTELRIGRPARDELVQSLENEAAYLDQVKKPDLAKEVRKRLESLAAG